MDWKLLFCMSAALLATEGSCQSLSEPSILTPSGQTVNSNVGESVVLTCQVANLNSNKVNWVFVTHSHIIFHGDSLQVDDDRYSIVQAPHGDRYSLQINPVQESDQGSYKCEVDGTKEAIIFHLVVQGAPEVPQVDTTPLNKTDCCIEQGVSVSCQKVCHPSSLDDTFDSESACSASDVLSLVHCGTDGRNHETCCARRNIPALCLTLCSNDAQRMSQLSDEELACLNYTDSIISCYEYGSVMLPGPPQGVSVLSRSSGDGKFGLLVSWQPPVLSPSAVTGYRVSYKKTLDEKYKTTEMLSSSTRQFMVNNLLVNTEYSVYITAVAHHGSSQPSTKIQTVLEDTSLPGFASDVLSCCVQRRVSPECQTVLCHPNVWSTFNTTNMLQCYHFLSDVFTCLAGGGNHTPCCSNNNVPQPCLGMCSGQPPTFDTSLAQCIPKLSTIEACVQLGLDSQPTPPLELTLTSVSAREARISWKPSNHSGSTPIQKYYVQLRRGNENAQWMTVDIVYGTQAELTNLTETENYGVRVIAQNQDDSSLPSETLRFTTYPVVVAGTDRPVVPHNVTQCCFDSGMPEVCALGCQYQSNITDYYANHLLDCFSHIGQVLACGADGRDHSACCEREEMEPICLPLCAHTQVGELDPTFYACIEHTAIAVQCFKEGLEDLVRMPDNVTVSDTTNQHIQIEWLAPKTGPRPEKYVVFYKNVKTGANQTDETENKVYILQNLMPGTMYEIKVASYFNNSYSPYTNTITAFTSSPAFPIIPQDQTSGSLGLWNNRTHCCQSNGISADCQSVCLNQPADSSVDCSSETHKILICSADGKDHSLCCQEGGLAEVCLPLCSSATASNFSVHTAGCLADASLGIITSCFLSNSNLIPSPPERFSVDVTATEPKLWWKASTVNCAAPEGCLYDVHYWPTDNKENSTVIRDVTAPYIVRGLVPHRRYTFTVTARNSKGSSAAAPWQTAILVPSRPDVSIAQIPNVDIHEVGSYVTLVCDAINFGQDPEFTWTYFGREMGKTRRLYMRRITEESEGNYTCTAKVEDTAVSVNSYLNIRFKPHQTYIRTDTVSPNIGGQAILACWFRGHPFTNTTRTTWTKDGDTVQVSSSRYSSSAKTRLHTGITAFRLKIAKVVPSDYGTYKCTVSNQYGTAVGTTVLMDPDRLPPEVTIAPQQAQNITGCCSRHGMPEVCLRLCRYEVDTVEAVNNPTVYGVCLYYFSELINCAADGADHTYCCRKNSVAPYCLPFCAGKVPPSEDVFDDPELLQCVPQTPTMFDCLARGYDRIPTAPTRLNAKITADSIVVRWGLPQRNADRVEFYRVYFNFTGRPAPAHHLVASHLNTYSIKNVLSDHIYNVWMIAGNDYGESHASERKVVSVHGVLPMPPRGVKATVFDGLSVDVEWTPPPTESARVDGYVVYYKPVNDARFQLERTRKTTIRISGLKPETEYDLRVKSVNVNGESQISSNVVKFTTGTSTGTTGSPGGYEGPHREAEISGAQIAGIILAVVAVIAIGVVIFLIISKSRIQRQKLAESVSFENPGYGNQQVHITGMPGEAPYDNVMQPKNQPEEDGSFGYSRLNEDQATAAAAAAAASASSVPEMEYPSAKYVYDNAGEVKQQETNGPSQEVATLPVSDITAPEKNESTT